MRRFILSGVLLAATLAIAPLAHSQNYRAEYKLSTVLPASYAWGKAGERWAELVKEKTQGRINIKMYPGMSLVAATRARSSPRCVRAPSICRSAPPSTGRRKSDIESVFAAVPDARLQGHRCTDQGRRRQATVRHHRKSGVVPLAWGENGFRELSNSKGAIASPADMKGKKFRVVGSPIFIDTFTALGANPTQMSFADAQPALSTGAVDGQENPLSVFMGAKLWTLKPEVPDAVGLHRRPAGVRGQQGGVGILDPGGPRGGAPGSDPGRRGKT